MSLEQREIQADDTNYIALDRAMVNKLSLIPRMMKAAAGVCGIPYELVNSDRRCPLACRARFIVMNIAFTHYNMSKSLIGKRLHGRDHTTVMAGIRRSEKLIKTDPLFEAQLDEVLKIVVGTKMMPVMVPMEELKPIAKPAKVKKLVEIKARYSRVIHPEIQSDEDVRRMTAKLVEQLQSYHPELEDRRVAVRMRLA